MQDHAGYSRVGHHGGGAGPRVRRRAVPTARLTRARPGAPGGEHAAQGGVLYRRNLYEPEILTFDELLARAEWHVALAEGELST